MNLIMIKTIMLVKFQFKGWLKQKGIVQNEVR
jgi:hypothetical protein